MKGAGDVSADSWRGWQAGKGGGQTRRMRGQDGEDFCPSFPLFITVRRTVFTSDAEFADKQGRSPDS